MQIIHLEQEEDDFSTFFLFFNAGFSSFYVSYFLINMTEVSEQEFDTWFDDQHGDIYIGEHSYPASRALKAVDSETYNQEKKKYEQDE